LTGTGRLGFGDGYRLVRLWATRAAGGVGFAAGAHRGLLSGGVLLSSPEQQGLWCRHLLWLRYLLLMQLTALCCVWCHSLLGLERCCQGPGALGVTVGLEAPWAVLVAIAATLLPQQPCVCSTGILLLQSIKCPM